MKENFHFVNSYLFSCESVQNGVLVSFAAQWISKLPKAHRLTLDVGQSICRQATTAPQRGTQPEDRRGHEI
jgi:hypothetical protein